MRVCGRGLLQPGTLGLSLPWWPRHSLFPTDMFPKAAKRGQFTGPPGKKPRGKERRPDGGTYHRPSKAKGKPQRDQAKLGRRGAVRDRRRGQARPPKKVV